MQADNHAESDKVTRAGKEVRQLYQGGPEESQKNIWSNAVQLRGAFQQVPHHSALKVALSP